MHVCPECGKSMATAGGLEIHLEMVHAAALEPAAEPALEPAGSPPVDAAPSAPTQTRTRTTTAPAPAPAPRASVTSARPQLQPAPFLRRFDTTVPMTAVLVLALLVGGVGAALHRSSTGPSTPGASGQTEGTTPNGSPIVINAAADEHLAQSLVLDQNDFPDGWTFSPHVRDATDAATNRKLATCLGRPDPAAVQTADVDGVDGSAGNSLHAGSNVSTLRAQRDAGADLDTLLSDKAVPCLKQDVVDSLGRDGIRVLNVGVGRYSVSTANVRSLGLHFEIAVASGPAGGRIYADEVFLQQGRIEGQAFFLSISGHFPSDSEQTLVTRFAHKLAMSPLR